MTIALAIAMTFSLSAQADLTGIWNIGEDDTKVEFFQEQQGIINGKIISSDNPKAKIGKIIVKEVKLKGGKWVGKIYSPKRKTWYDVAFERKQNKLAVVVSTGFFNKEMEWKRAI